MATRKPTSYFISLKGYRDRQVKHLSFPFHEQYKHWKVALDKFSGSFTTIDDRAIGFAVLLDCDCDQNQNSASTAPPPNCIRPLSR